MFVDKNCNKTIIHGIMCNFPIYELCNRESESQHFYTFKEKNKKPHEPVHKTFHLKLIYLVSSIEFLNV